MSVQLSAHYNNKSTEKESVMITKSKVFDILRAFISVYANRFLVNQKYVPSYAIGDLFYLYDVLSEAEPQDVIVLTRQDKDGTVQGIEWIVRRKQLSQFDCSHIHQYEMYKNSYILTAFSFVKEKYGEAFTCTDLPNPEETLKSWDSEAERIKDPTNDGVFLEFCDKEYLGLHQANMAFSRENGSIKSLVRCFTYLACKEAGKESNQRVVIYPNRDREYYFEMKRIGRDGQWKRIMNGGIIYHQSSNEWSTHT
jgi:hypothetical protein